MLSRLLASPVLPRATRATRALAAALAALIALVWLLTPSVASAHAHLVEASPAPDSVVAGAPSVALFTFDEPLNPALTRVRVTDAAGHPVTAATGSLAPGHDGELWRLPLPRLTFGTYSVFWTSESATDGHVMASFYTFRVAPSGGASGVGAVTGTAAGGGRVAGTGSGAEPALNGGTVAVALLHAIGLMAQALWLGALLVELVVLAPARRRAGSPQARLAWAAAPRVWWLVRGAPVVAVWALAAEVVSLALEGTGGDWNRALDPGTLGGILSSQNGHLIVLRFAALLLAVLLAGGVRVPTVAPASPASPTAPDPSETPASPLAERRRPRRSSQALGITAPVASLPAAPRWETVRVPLAALAALYMLLVALSGHAADVKPLLLSYAIDWSHLFFTAAWAGGIAALAYGVLPLRRALPPRERAPAVAPLLDRFSPLAYAAVAALALSGLYNALAHLDSPTLLASTSYGELLILKLALVALLMGLSASHVWGLRPRIARLQAAAYGACPASTPARRPSPGGDVGDAEAGVHEGLATLAGRLRAEGWVGAAILTATALMTWTLPPVNSASARATAHPTTEAGVRATPATPVSIAGSATAGDLRVTLTVAPPAVGASTFTLALSEKGTPLTGDTGAAIIHLYPAGRPTLLAPLNTVARGTRFAARGSLPSAGVWRADVLVRTAAVADYRTLPFTFTVGPGAAFLGPGQDPAGIRLQIDPGRLGVPNAVTISGLQASRVRLLSESPNMRMGILPYVATPAGARIWRAGLVYPLMSGRWTLTVQAQRNGGWVSLRRFVYGVPAQGVMRLLNAGGTAPIASAPAVSATIAPAAVRWTGLPYRAVVSFADNGLVYVPGQPALTRVGTQNHSVARAPDGTMWVTDYFGGRVAVLDPASGRILKNIPVGIGPAHMAFARDGRRAYVADYFSSDISVVDVRARRVVATVPRLGLGPHALALAPDGRQLWVPCANGGGIYIVDTRTDKALSIVPTGGLPHAVAFSPDGRTAYMTDATPGAAKLVVVDTATLKIRARILIGAGSAIVAAGHDGRRVYVTGQSGSVLTVVDAATLHIVARVPVGKAPHGLTFTPDGRLLYIAVNDSRHVAVVDTRTDKVVATVSVPGVADELALQR